MSQQRSGASGDEPQAPGRLTVFPDLPEATVARLPEYLRALHNLAEAGHDTVSSEGLAGAAGLNSAKLRKDLSHLGSYGTRGVGYDVTLLIEQIEYVLGLTIRRSVALVGVGNLGHALAGYAGFASRGFRIAALFDADRNRIGEKINGLAVHHIDDLAEVVATEEISIAVIATPAPAAQAVVDRAGRVRRHQHPELRPLRAFGPGRRRCPQGRPRDRAADPVLPRAPQGIVDRASRVAASGRADIGGGRLMNLLVVGVSHRTANVAILDRLAASPQDTPHLLTDLMSQPYVGEAMVLSTCNRVEIYAGVTAFHGGLADVAAVLAARLGSTAADLAPHMYVHFDADAARHAFRVATGLDSMVVGEPQILGQLRDAYALAAERDTAGRLIHDVMQQALRVGKRAHAETDIDRAGQNVVSAALDLAAPRLPSGGLAGVSALVVGAGSMGALALATLRRNGAGQILVTNRDAARAARLADLHGATAVPFGDLADAVGTWTS